ncbi:hypothetical protein LHFGNBLO_000205 [Mesorhizobium sp. AR10]|uniref:hypothetical protein n=1 Tax=Mesorhizobium sp. AR10 TaxID=2865839 RepID=UPI00215E405D|nr:hypothetical protein [Mesorhizobium sp. AR10]UVK38901.1 hypothetical protein LHFGNBLO_000205 [Mesorhizobium sp. AR10]
MAPAEVVDVEIVNPGAALATCDLVEQQVERPIAAGFEHFQLVELGAHATCLAFDDDFGGRIGRYQSRVFRVHRAILAAAVSLLLGMVMPTATWREPHFGHLSRADRRLKGEVPAACPQHRIDVQLVAVVALTIVFSRLPQMHRACSLTPWFQASPTVSIS